MAESVKARLLQICTELGEDLDSPACKAVQQYIKTCPDCEAFVDSVKKTITLYRTYEPPYREDIQQRLYEKLHLD